MEGKKSWHIWVIQVLWVSDGRRRRPSIVVERMETLTQPDSILPVRSGWQHSDKLLLNHSQRVSCLALLDQNYFHILSTSLDCFQTAAHRFVAGTVWMCTLMAVWSDKVPVLTGQLWEVPLFPCLYPLYEAGVVVNHCRVRAHLSELLRATSTS